MIKPHYRNMVEPGAPFGLRSTQLPVLTAGIASLRSWDATRGRRSVGERRAAGSALALAS